MQKKLNIIVAMDINNIIGHDEKIPWSLADDFKENFVPKTKNCAIIMGSKTALTLPGPLKRRKNIVLSRNNNLILPEGFIIANHAWDAIKSAKDFEGNTIWCIGGAQIYNLFENFYPIDEYHITYVKGDFPASTGIEEIIYKPRITGYKIISQNDFVKRNPSENDRGNSHDFTTTVYSI